MRNINVANMTVLLAIGCDNPLASPTGTVEKKTQKNTVYNRYPAAVDHDTHEIAVDKENAFIDEYLSLTIIFPKLTLFNKKLSAPRLNYGLPQPDVIKLLTRLKAKYSLRLGVISDKTIKKHDPIGQSSSFNHIVDFYIWPNYSIADNFKSYSINHVNFFTTRLELAAYGLWDY